MKKKHAIETKQHPKNLKLQQANIRKSYKTQYNAQNKEYKSLREQIMNKLTYNKDQIKEKLEQIKDEQNRKFSILYEHYKTNLDQVYQDANLKLNSGQQMEQDQLNEDLERQINVLFQSHSHRKQQQMDLFMKEAKNLDYEREQKFHDLEAKIQRDLEEFECNSRDRITKLKTEQMDFLQKFDKECFEKYSIMLTPLNQHQNNINNRYSMCQTVDHAAAASGASSFSAAFMFTNGSSSELNLNSTASSCSNSPSVRKLSQNLTKSLADSSSSSSTLSNHSNINQQAPTIMYLAQQPGQNPSTSSIAYFYSNSPAQSNQQPIIYNIDLMNRFSSSNNTTPTNNGTNSPVNRRNSTAFN